MKVTQSEQLHRDKARLTERMGDYDEGCIVAGQAIGLTKNRASHVFNKIKQELGKSQCQ
jgi:hypothetical protein